MILVAYSEMPEVGTRPENLPRRRREILTRSLGCGRAVSEVREIETRIGRVRLAAALLAPRIQYEREVGAVDGSIAVDVSAAREATAAHRRGDFYPTER